MAITPTGPSPVLGNVVSGVVAPLDSATARPASSDDDTTAATAMRERRNEMVPPFAVWFPRTRAESDRSSGAPTCLSNSPPGGHIAVACNA